MLVYRPCAWSDVTLLLCKSILEEIFDEVQLLLEEVLAIDDGTKRNERLVRVGS